jgi:hypothetical protein
VAVSIKGKCRDFIVLFYLAPAVVKPGENTTTEVPEDGFRFFQAECTAFSAYVMVEQVDLSGLCSLYASSIKPNPVPLDSNSTVMRNEDHNTNKRSIILTGVKKVRD